ncbi:hypothetical protein PLICRDRAFT_38973 [Plicaturopsis crispa FD-325 SS-3]|nr:hypothetical protein PLICRDRAFT_38973 [Plicaturopsis crispa FD-325 SS-3]
MLSTLRHTLSARKPVGQAATSSGIRRFTQRNHPRTANVLPRLSPGRAVPRYFSSSSSRRVPYVRFTPDPQRPFDFRRWTIGTYIGGGVLLGCTTYYIAHLEQVPQTGRWRFMDVSPKYETILAKEMYSQLIEEYKGHILPPNHAVTRHVKRVVSRLLAANNLGHFASDEFADGWGVPVDRGDGVTPESGGREWHLLVVNDPKTPNAMASGGTIVVFTGIFPLVKDEQGLASVISHEIGHIVARHTSERISHNKVVIAIAQLFQFLGFPIDVSGIVAPLLALSHSRQTETEADIIGLTIAANACYDPSAAIRFFSDNQQREGRSSKLDFLYTHPSGETRVKTMKALLPAAQQIVAANPECATLASQVEGFRETAMSLVLGDRRRSSRRVPIAADDAPSSADERWRGEDTPVSTGEEILQEKW